MRLGNWNIGEDERHEGGVLDKDSYDYIVNMIKGKNLDIICLQEAVTSSLDLPVISEYIAENTDLKYFVQFELSDSHINKKSRMGVTIVSKYKIENSEKKLFDNPNVTYFNKEKNKTYRPADKGIIMADINGLRVVSGHGIPFYAFRIALDKRYQYCANMEKYIVDNCRDKKWLLMGDLNEDNLKVIFPKITNLTRDVVKVATYKDKIYDHILISKRIKSKGVEIVDTVFDHKLCILEVI